MATAALLAGLAGCAAPPVDPSKIPVAKFIGEVSRQVDLFQGWVNYRHLKFHDKPVGVCLTSIDFSLSTTVEASGGASLTLAAAQGTSVFGFKRTGSNGLNYKVTYVADYSQTPSRLKAIRTGLTDEGELDPSAFQRDQFAAALFTLRRGLQQAGTKPESGPGLAPSSVATVFTVKAEQITDNQINLVLLPVSASGSLTQSAENIATVTYEDRPGEDGLCRGKSPSSKKGVPAAVALSRVQTFERSDVRNLMVPAAPR